MSDDAKRSSIMDSYLYGGDAAKAAAESYARADDDIVHSGVNDDSNRRRSKSFDPSKTLGEGMSRTKNTEIERGVRIKYKSLHSLASDQNERIINDKSKLNELNTRLDDLVNAIKMKKLQNDNLELEIKNYKDQVLNSSDNSLRKQYTADLDEAKKELNDVSQLSSLSKIRASRSLYDLETLRDKYEVELKLQTSTREKINYLENQRGESLHEISYLKESCENREKSNHEDEDKNEKLRQQIMDMSIRLDGEVESRVDLECRCQTMIEQKKFEEDINNLMREELEKLFLYHGKNKLFDDPQHFFNTELNQIKERIREDFRKLNDFSSQSLREEYEFKYTKTVEEIEIARKKAEEDRINQENEEMITINNLKQEHLENEEELKNLRLNGFRLSQTLEELRNRLTDHSSNLHSESEKRDIEIANLIEQINNLKIEMSTMLNFSKTLDSEVSVYARLLNERFTQFMSTDITEEYDSTKFSYDKYKESIFGNTQDEDNEARRRQEQEELRKKQLELEQHQKRLRELELEREREREAERSRKLKELELEEQRQEQRRRQLEIDEMNRQREHEEELRRLREEDELRRQLEIDEEDRRQREREEARRLREEEDAQRRLREQEEAQRRQREIEEQKKLQEIEEKQRRQREIEEQNRLRELERRQYELELETKRIWDLEQKRLREVDEQERFRQEEEERMRLIEEEERIRQAAYEIEQRKLKEEDEQRRINEQRRREEYELQQRYEEIEHHRCTRYEDEIALQKIEEEHVRLREYELEQQRIREVEEALLREQQRLQEIEDKKNRDREVELKRLEDIIVAEQQRKINEAEVKRQREEDDLRLRRQIEIESEKKRLEEIEIQRVLREQEDHRRQKEIEEQQRRIKEEQHRQWEAEQIRMREIEETNILKQRRQLEQEQNRRLKEQRENELKLQEQERQRRLELEREEREKYILEKLKQEQELLELQKRQKLMVEQREREEHELEYRQRQQQEIQPQYQHSQREVKCIDNVSMVTKRITEEKHKSTEIYEEERIEHIPGNNISSDTVEKQINIKLQPSNDNYHQQHQSSQNLTSESSSSSRQRVDSRHESNSVDHCVSSNNGHKHVLIVNSFKPKPISNSISNVHTINSRSQSPPKVRTTYNSSSNDALSTAICNKTDTLSPKYAIKHKANRYVSGAIGILETSLNGEYIILENLSSNKNVNLKGWYIHRYVPDQNINLIFKFVNDTMLCCGEKLKILSRSCSTKVRSTSMYESVNKPNHSVTESFKPKDKYISDGSEKILIASNIENWGTYSKFSVTKLINPDGVDKAVLTQSLLRLASSTSNVNITSPRDSSPNIKQQQQQQSNNSSYYYNRAISNHNNANNKYRSDNEININHQHQHAPQRPSYYEQYSPRSQHSASETVSTKTTKKVETSSSSQITTMSSAPYLVESNTLPGNLHITRQF